MPTLKKRETALLRFALGVASFFVVGYYALLLFVIQLLLDRGNSINLFLDFIEFFGGFAFAAWLTFL